MEGRKRHRNRNPLLQITTSLRLPFLLLHPPVNLIHTWAFQREFQQSLQWQVRIRKFTTSVAILLGYPAAQLVALHGVPYKTRTKKSLIAPWTRIDHRHDRSTVPAEKLDVNDGARRNYQRGIHCFNPLTANVVRLSCSGLEVDEFNLLTVDYGLQNRSKTTKWSACSSNAARMHLEYVSVAYYNVTFGISASAQDRFVRI